MRHGYAMSKEKDLNISFLLDFYGDILKDEQREAMELCYNDDLSLSEISETIGITRQGVRSRLLKGQKTLFGLEEKLGLAKRFAEMEKTIDVITEKLKAIMNSDNSEEIERIIELADSLKG